MVVGCTDGSSDGGTRSIKIEIQFIIVLRYQSETSNECVRIKLQLGQLKSRSHSIRAIQSKKVNNGYSNPQTRITNKLIGIARKKKNHN